MLPDQLRMEARVGEIVCDVFPDKKRYHGRVTEVRFHELHAVYMYHVVWEDNDEQDCWRHELEVIKCDCRDRDRAVDTSEGSSDSE